MIDIEELRLESTQRTDALAGVVLPNKLKANDQVKQDSLVPFLPGQAIIFVKTWGCGHNNSDGEYMAGLLAAQGYTILLNDAEKNNADLWLLNSCTVKGPSEQTFINEIEKASKEGKKVCTFTLISRLS
jgi:threonylcarbamoyladenosine tRNA methylthiotransferase CDKAL1